MAAVADLERFLERVFERTSARLFRSRVQAVQVEQRVERAMESGRTGRGSATAVPSRYRVRLHPADLDDLAGRTGGYEALAVRLADRALAFARLHGYHLAARPVVSVVADPSLERGRMDVDASSSVPALAHVEPSSGLPSEPPTGAIGAFGAVRPPTPSPTPSPAPDAGPSEPPGAIPGWAPGAATGAAWGSTPGAAPGPHSYQEAAQPSAALGPPPDAAAPPVAWPGQEDPAELSPAGPPQSGPRTATAEHRLRAAGDRPYAVRPAPPPTSRALLRVVEGIGREREVRVDGQPLTLGRAPDNTLVIDDPRVSRHHGRFQSRHGTLVYTDLGSTNGTRVNGIRVDEIVLGPGDRLQVGDVVVVVEQLPG